MDDIEQVAWAEELKRLEKEIRKSDDGGLHLRWESGREMLRLRGGKRLPNGYLRNMEKAFKVHRSELTSRMKFAEKFPTEEQLTTVSSKSWFEIRQKVLTDTPKGGKTTASAVILRAYKAVRHLSDTCAVLTAEDHKVLHDLADLIEKWTAHDDEAGQEWRARTGDALAAVEM
jgi:hypothetical protein